MICQAAIQQHLIWFFVLQTFYLTVEYVFYIVVWDFHYQYAIYNKVDFQLY